MEGKRPSLPRRPPSVAVTRLIISKEVTTMIILRRRKTSHQLKRRSCRIPRGVHRMTLITCHPRAT